MEETRTSKAADGSGAPGFAAGAPEFAAGAPEFAVGRRVAGMKLVDEDDDGRSGSVARKIVAARLLRGSTTSEMEEATGGLNRVQLRLLWRRDA